MSFWLGASCYHWLARLALCHWAATFKTGVTETFSVFGVVLIYSLRLSVSKTLSEAWVESPCACAH